MSSLQNRVQQMHHDDFDSTSKSPSIQSRVIAKSVLTRNIRMNRSSDEGIKIRRKCHSRPLISKRPVTPDREQGFIANDVTRKIFYYNIQERLNNVKKILDQFEVSPSSEDENTPFELNEKDTEDIPTVTSVPDQRTHMHHPPYESAQRTVASFIADDTESGNASSILSHLATLRSSSHCQNPYYQSVHSLGNKDQLINNNLLPVQTIIFGDPGASIHAKGNPRDDSTTLTASETATIYSFGTDIQTVNFAQYAAEISDDDDDSDNYQFSSNRSKEDKRYQLRKDEPPDTPTLSIASDRAIIGAHFDTYPSEVTKSSDFPRKISFQNSADICYTSFKDLVKSEQDSKMKAVVDNQHAYSEEKAEVEISNTFVDIQEPKTPSASKSSTSIQSHLDLVKTPLISEDELSSPFKALNEEGNEISRVKETEDYENSFCSVTSADTFPWNGIDGNAVSSLDLFQKKSRPSQECACTVM